jgi:hypothetical protein
MTVRADVLLRALAIIFVTYNHAHPYSGFDLGWGGGMTFLMMLSGYNFARFGMRESTPEKARSYLLRLGRGIFIPSIVAVAFFFVLLQKFSFPELLFYRNWLTPERIAKFPTWYPQVILQMFAGLILLFAIPSVGKTILRWPLISSLLLFGAALAVRASFPYIWDTSHLYHHLPHLYLWNFCLGWIVYFGVNQWPHLWGKALAIGCSVLGAFVWGVHNLDFYWLTVGVALLVLPLDVRMPSPLGQFFQLVSQATLAIFLLHRFVYEVYEHMPIPHNEDAMWIIGLFGSLLTWMVATASARAFRALWRQSAQSNQTKDLSALSLRERELTS